MSRILIVEDEPAIALGLEDDLKMEGYDVEVARDGISGANRALDGGFDLVLLDVMLPGKDGFEVCRELRARANPTPVVMLTARSQETEKVLGLELGADDYVTKPFSPKELVARVAALLRRLERPANPPLVLRYGPITMDMARHEVRAASANVQLTAKEFLLLRYLIEHRGRVLSRDLLLTDVWGYQYTGGTRTVDVHVRRLREKLPLLETALVTIKQFGYRLDDPASVGA